MTSLSITKNCSTQNYREENFCHKKYLVIALVSAAVAGAIFSFCAPAAITLFTIASWSLLSAGVVILNQVSCATWAKKTINRIHAVVTEVNSIIASAALFPLTLFPCYHSSKGNQKGEPILMVNGYLSFGSTWDYQREMLIKAGFGPIYTINVGTGKSIKTYSKKIQKKINRIGIETGKNTISLIGHSKGGLVISDYVTRLASANPTVTITNVITIGSPFRGTPAAHIGPGKDASEMQPRSPFLADLRTRIKRHKNTRFFHIASEADSVVSERSAIPGTNSDQQLRLKDMGHLGLIFSSRVAHQISHWLKTKTS